ncbi:MAG: hypothetical protein QHG99_01650 [Methanomicrobiales archaeon]|nr:hypothetical protein [Methanomicrobiales archaeon]
MIFPRECKEVGYSRSRPCGDRVYFLTRYLIRAAGEGHELLRITPDGEGKGLMRVVVRAESIASPEEVSWYPEKVCLHDRWGLVSRAMESETRCTIFRGEDEHITFVLDPDPDQFLTVHVFDVTPPAPSLSAAILGLEACGIFGELDVRFIHHLHDISSIGADVYPCRAGGFPRTLDSDPMQGGERIAGCRTGAELYRECYGDDFVLENICPLDHVNQEPFIARCCRSEREGIGRRNGMLGAVVHWAAPPMRIAHAVHELCRQWRSA